MIGGSGFGSRAGSAGGRWQRSAPTSTTELTVSVPWSGTAHTKGAWTEIVASTDCPWSTVTVEVHTPSESYHYLLDVAVGASGSETTIIENLPFKAHRVETLTHTLPMMIPAGSRISARIQSSGGTPVDVTVAGGWHRGVRPPTARRLTTVGVDTAATRPTLVDTGASANTKSGWVELVASTPHRTRLLTPIIGVWPTVDSADPWIGQHYLADVGVGAAGSETVIVPDLPHAAMSTARREGSTPLTIPVDVPAGSRISVRAQCDSTGTDDRRLHAALLLGA